MVKIRLKRMGGHKKPFYRIVVADSRRSRNGKFIEEIGFFDPLADPDVIKIDAEAAQKWLADGAQPTERVRSLFRKEGIIQ
ncbi:MAG: 30S ribosomal protein S16 [Anaerovoracaceae bacterium]|jgi:small subunit ribosomal protein S16